MPWLLNELIEPVSLDLRFVSDKQYVRFNVHTNFRTSRCPVHNRLGRTADISHSHERKAVVSHVSDPLTSRSQMRKSRTRLHLKTTICAIFTRKVLRTMNLRLSDDESCECSIFTRLRLPALILARSFEELLGKSYTSTTAVCNRGIQILNPSTKFGHIVVPTVDRPFA